MPCRVRGGRTGAQPLSRGACAATPGMAVRMPDRWRD